MMRWGPNESKKVHYGRKQEKTQTLSHEWAVRANERTDERVAQYCSLYFWLFSTIVQWREIYPRMVKSVFEGKKMNKITIFIAFTWVNKVHKRGGLLSVKSHGRKKKIRWMMKKVSTKKMVIIGGQGQMQWNEIFFCFPLHVLQYKMIRMPETYLFDRYERISQKRKQKKYHKQWLKTRRQRHFFYFDSNILLRWSNFRKWTEEQ